jgi:hypothetical protein
MVVEQQVYRQDEGWADVAGAATGEEAQLVLAFGSRDIVAEAARFDEMRQRWPQARIAIGSTAGEIVDSEVCDNSLTATAIRFERSKVETACVSINKVPSAFAAGEALAAGLPQEGLVHVFVLSDGHQVNGSELAKGLNSRLPQAIAVTGGLAGDGTRFERTLVGLDVPPQEGGIVALGFYGADLRVGFGSEGGWLPFGPEREITRSEGNVLLELDGQSALTLYKKYLGDEAAGLPGSALKFPLCIATGGDKPLVRTILTIDEDAQSMTFAGDMPIGARARLMHASYDALVGGANTAAEDSVRIGSVTDPDLAICVSCVGRKIVMGQRTDEEIEAIRDCVGDRAVVTGFYSYGELAPFAGFRQCELHNQTMTITLLKEA